MLALWLGVCVLVWRLGAPPVVRVARVTLCRCEGRLRSGAPPSPAARPLGGLSGSAIRVLRARVRGRGGPVSVPLACIPCQGLRAAGVGGGVSGGMGIHRRPSLEAWGQGSAACVSRVWLSWAWGSGTGPSACMFPCEPLLRATAVAGGRPRGGALCGCEGRLHSGAVPPQARYQRAVCGGPALFPWLACPARGCVRLGWWGAVPGGGGLPPL